MVQEVLGDRGDGVRRYHQYDRNGGDVDGGLCGDGQGGRTDLDPEGGAEPRSVGVYIGLPLLLFSLELPDPFQSVVGFLADMNTLWQ